MLQSKILNYYVWSNLRHRYATFQRYEFQIFWLRIIFITCSKISYRYAHKHWMRDITYQFISSSAMLTPIRLLLPPSSTFHHSHLKWSSNHLCLSFLSALKITFRWFFRDYTPFHLDFSHCASFGVSIFCCLFARIGKWFRLR